jgi:hypothetical protein
MFANTKIFPKIMNLSGLRYQQRKTSKIRVTHTLGGGRGPGTTAVLTAGQLCFSSFIPRPSSAAQNLYRATKMIAPAFSEKAPYQGRAASPRQPPFTTSCFMRARCHFDLNIPEELLPFQATFRARHFARDCSSGASLRTRAITAAAEKSAKQSAGS